jgi:hypothetical protein
VAAIHLGPALPPASCGPPGDSTGPASTTRGRGPVRPQRGLAPGGVCQAGRSPGRWCALTAPFHPCHAPVAGPFGGLLSVALSCGSPRLAVGQHPALRRPDFPRPRVAPRPRPPSRLPLARILSSRVASAGIGPAWPHVALVPSRGIEPRQPVAAVLRTAVRPSALGMGGPRSVELRTSGPQPGALPPELCGGGGTRTPEGPPGPQPLSRRCPRPAGPPPGRKGQTTILQEHSRSSRLCLRSSPCTAPRQQHGPGRGARTPTPSRAPVPETGASTCSARPG